MIRSKRTLAYAFVSLAALAACSSDADPPAEMLPPVNDPIDTTDGDGDGAEPIGMEGDMPITTPGEPNVDGAPLTPGEQDDGNGDGDGNTPPVEPPAFAEDTGADCVVPELPATADLQELGTLPDPFLGLNGERLTRKDQWRCRRQEIKALAERFIYGEKPEKPEGLTGSVSATQLSVEVPTANGSVSFTATITLPPGASGPVPAVIGYGGSAFQDTILQEGVAFINYDVGQVGDETTRNPKVGAFYTANPNNQSTGMLVAWAWGVSRMLDVIEASGSEIIDPRAVGVTGCSRSGKGAFIAGAFDERIQLTIPFESGMAGVPAFRYIVREGGEVLRNAIEYRPWAGDAYQQFLQLGAPQSDPAALEAQNQASGQMQALLPIDTHEVIGMIAPRGLYVMGNPAIVNLAPDTENITVQAGREIYAALGVAENLSYNSNTANGNHCQFRQEFVPLLQQNLRKFLKGDEAATTGTLDTDARLTGQLAPNIAWETPTLE